MIEFTPLIIDNEKKELNSPDSVFDFEHKEIDLFGFNHEEILDGIISTLLSQPKRLETHLQRIYFCYQHDLHEDLFAALIDFLIILKGKGVNIKQRMVNGAKSKLTPGYNNQLQEALTLSAHEIELAEGNLYSVFTQGLVGTCVLIKKETQKEHHYDPLTLARDYVAYSQLDMAIKTLEEAVMVDFENQALHHDLLELYQLTRNKDKFLKMYTLLTEKMVTITIPFAWEKLKVFFDEA